MHSRLVRFFLILLILISYTCFKAIQLWPTRRCLAVFLCGLLFLTMLSGMFLYRADPTVLTKSWFRWLSWTGALAMGLWATFVLFSLPFDGLSLLTFGYDRFLGTRSVDAERRFLVTRGFHFMILGSASVLAGLGLAEVWRGPRVKKVPVGFKKLNPALEGLRIAQISDLHVGPTIGKGYVEEMVRRTNETDPDLIFVTGDIADAEAETIAEHLEPLSRLRARHGIFYVTGNHEYYSGAQGIIDRLRDFGFVPLINENRVVRVGNARLLIAGVTDPVGGGFLAGHHPDPERAARTDEKPDFRALLAHRPDAYVEAEKLGFDMQFSGHTHAGQFFPFSWVVRLAHKYYRGLNRHENLWVYVNPGTGYWGPPNRFTIPAEITLVTLTKDPTATTTSDRAENKA